MRGRSRGWTAPRAVLVAFGLVAAGLLAVLWMAYRSDLAEARVRVASSRLAQTPCGPIEYAEAGSGPPLLVIHGAGGGFDQGQDFSEPLLPHGFRVVAVSRFGYLRTPLPADASPAAQARAHACLLDALGIDRVAVLGGSAGAPSAIQFALLYPERTTRLVLLVPAVFVPRPAGIPAVTMPAGLQFVFDTALRSDFLLWATIRVAPWFLAESALATPASLVATASDREKARVLRVMEHVLPVTARRPGLVNDGAVTSALPRYELERVAAPTLVISAADDLFGTFDSGRYTAQQIPGARFVGFSSGGHLLVGREHEQVAEVVAFLR
jgi:2-hydroxy-6-oxonona-2,4-dienedioate hydrolase